VCFQRTGSFFMSLPIAAGDYVLVVVCQKNIAKWLGNGAQGDPGDTETHTLDGAVAIPGVFPTANALASASSSNMVIGKDGVATAQIEITATEVHLGASASHPVVWGDVLLAKLNSMITARALGITDPLAIILHPILITDLTTELAAMTSAVLTINSPTTKTI